MGFVTWPECKRCWEIITDSSPSVCLDPPPGKVGVYIPAFLCDKTAPELCDQHITVADQYDKKFRCTPKHDQWYKDIDFYKAKCNKTSHCFMHRGMKKSMLMKQDESLTWWSPQHRKQSGA